MEPLLNRTLYFSCGIKSRGTFLTTFTIFIEPKGAHIAANDNWKEEFLLQIGEKAILSFETPNDKYRIWGLPFYNESRKQVFNCAIKNSLDIQ